MKNSVGPSPRCFFRYDRGILGEKFYFTDCVRQGLLRVFLTPLFIPIPPLILDPRVAVYVLLMGDIRA